MIIIKYLYRKKKKDGKKEIPEKAKIVEEEYPSFFCRIDKVRMKKGATINLPLIYLPLYHGE